MSAKLLNFYKLKLMLKLKITTIINDKNFIFKVTCLTQILIKEKHFFVALEVILKFNVKYFDIVIY